MLRIITIHPADEIESARKSDDFRAPGWIAYHSVTMVTNGLVMVSLAVEYVDVKLLAREQKSDVHVPLYAALLDGSNSRSYNDYHTGRGVREVGVSPNWVHGWANMWECELIYDMRL